MDADRVKLYSQAWPSLSRRAALRGVAGGGLAALGLAAGRSPRPTAAQADALPPWVRVGTPADALYSGGYGLFATAPDTGNLWQYLGQPLQWQEIGGPGSQFAVTADALYGLSPDRSGIYRYDGTPLVWTLVGTAAVTLSGGGYGLFATSPATGNLWQYLGQPLRWQEIGGPGSQFAVTATGLFGLSPDRSGIYRYDGTPLVWTLVGTTAQEIYGGGYGLFATAPDTGNLWQYLGQPLQWQEIGGPGSLFAVTADALYGLSPDRSGVYRYDGTPFAWTQVGTAVETIVPGGPVDPLYALAPQTRDVWALLSGTAAPQPQPAPPLPAPALSGLLIYHQITAFPDGSPLTQAAILSADGTRAAFANKIATDDPASYGRYRIYVLAADGSGVTQVDDYEILSNSNPQVELSANGGTVLSADGVQIRLASAGGARELLALEDIRLGAVRLTADGGTVVFVVSPDSRTRDGGQELPRGVWAIDAGGGTLRQLVRAEAVATVLGVPVEAVTFGSGGSGPEQLAVSDDGGVVAFSAYAFDFADEQHYVLGAAGGGAPRVLLGPVAAVGRVAVSGDGQMVAYDVIRPGAEFEDNEVGVIAAAGGAPRTLLTRSNSSGDPLQLSRDGGRLLVSPDGLLIDTATSAAWQLAVRPTGGDPLLLRDALPSATMDATATRFLFQPIRDQPSEPGQLATLDLATTELGAAPSITDPIITPATHPGAGEANAIASADIRFDGTLVTAGVNGLRDGRATSDLYGALIDDGTHGDGAAGDGRYAAELLASRTAEPGPWLLRIGAEIEAADGRRHATALEVGPLTLVP